MNENYNPMLSEAINNSDLDNNPFKGFPYRFFEIAGDSMMPTLKEGNHVIAEKIDKEYWGVTSQFHIYVIVTEDRVMAKRLYRKDENTYVVISDCEEFYPQFILPKKEVEELWLVLRRVDWELDAPKRFEITQ